MTPLPSCLSEAAFSALLQYSPYGSSAAAEAAKDAVLRIKRGAPRYMERIAERLLEELRAGGLAGVFSSDCMLVPVPRSRPFRDRDSLWPAKRICEYLRKQDIGAGILELLSRAEAVAKSALARSAAERPKPEDHIRTMVVHQAARDLRHVVVVDDVITRGATLLAAISLLRHCFPDALVTGFAVVRTMSDRDIDQMLAPVSGRITYSQGRLHREP